MNEVYTIKVGDKTYGFESPEVLEVWPGERMQKIPWAEPPLCGVLIYRGEVVPVVTPWQGKMEFIILLQGEKKEKVGVMIPRGIQESRGAPQSGFQCLKADTILEEML